MTVSFWAPLYEHGSRRKPIAGRNRPDPLHQDPSNEAVIFSV
jgi:hypothetical protein